MNDQKENTFSRSVPFFHDRVLPDQMTGSLVGYASLIDVYHLKVPLPEKLAVISERHQKYETETWAVFTPRHQPEATLIAHLTFALKYEGVDLGVLKSLFQQIDPDLLVAWVKAEPTGKYSRRVWFLYEWLMDRTLALPDAKTGRFVEILDPQQQYPGPIEISKRHRVRNNLPGVREFCPLVRRTKILDTFLRSDLGTLAHKETGAIHPDVLKRAAAFLSLKDSKASFEIEGENPGHKRAERWGKVIGHAGLIPLSIQEIVRLQAILIEDTRFVPLGLRHEGGFIGMHDRSTGAPLPDHISARPQDLPSLMAGLIDTYHRLQKGPLDSILSATMIAFGFVFIHPFVDGNGRLHRYLIHHLLAELGFSPKGLIFPISAVILDHIDAYRQTLEAYSRPRLECIEWRSTSKNNVEVLNDTADLYRYFDATRQAEFLYGCIQQTIEKSLPAEIRYLEQYDGFKSAFSEQFDMPTPMMDMLLRFLHQNKGTLSKRARENEFKALSEAECLFVEELYAQHFG